MICLGRAWDGAWTRLPAFRQPCTPGGRFPQKPALPCTRLDRHARLVMRRSGVQIPEAAPIVCVVPPDG